MVITVDPLSPSFCPFFSHASPCLQLDWDNRLSSWMGNLLASIPHLSSASILLFWARTWMSSGTQSSSSALLCLQPLTPSCFYSMPSAFASPTTEHSSIHHFPLVSPGESVLPDLPPLFWSSHSSLCSAQASKSAFRKNPRGNSIKHQWLRPHCSCPEPRAQSLVRN